MAYRVKEALLTCPFEPTHQILPHRMAQHIIKCRKNYPEMDMKTCPFNATHVIPVRDYQAHILECPDKAIVERDIYRRQEVEDAMKIKRAAGITMPSVSVWEENWDEELVENTYNPQEAILIKEIARPPPPGTMGKAGRRAWRQAEIDRVTNQKNGSTFVDLEYPDISLNGSTSFLGGATSMHDPKLSEKDVDKNILTANKCNLAMRADQPLRRPNILLQKKATRIAANFFGDSLEKDTQCMTSSRDFGSRI